MADDAARKQPESISLERDAPTERFIRTFESDSATVKSGGKPDFMKTSAVPQAAQMTTEDRKAQSVANNATDTIDISKAGNLSSIPSLTADMMPITRTTPVPMPPPAPRPIPPPAPAPVPKPVPPPPPPPTIPEPVPASAAPIHTYTSDFADAVADKKATPATILAAEQDAGQPVAAPQKRTLNLPLIIGAIALLIVGAGGVYAAYLYTNKPTTVPAIILTPARIFVDERQQITGTGTALEQALEQSVAKELNTGAIRLVYTPTATTSDQSVFSALQLGAPDILLRNITAEGSMAGVVNVQAVQSPFFILAVQSYSDTFAGMLQWEPGMQASVAGLYPLYPAPPVRTVVGTSTAATSTPPVAPSALPAFRDEVVSNHDARVLKDTAGNTLIIYGYWDAHTLLIARDEAAFTEIIDRLANSRTAQ